MIELFELEQHGRYLAYHIHSKKTDIVAVSWTKHGGDEYDIDVFNLGTECMDSASNWVFLSKIELPKSDDIEQLLKHDITETMIINGCEILRRSSYGGEIVSTVKRENTFDNTYQYETWYTIFGKDCFMYSVDEDSAIKSHQLAIDIVKSRVTRF